MNTQSPIPAILTALILAACAQTDTPDSPSEPARHSSDQQQTTGNLIIFYDPATGPAALTQAVRQDGAEIIYEYRNFNGIAVRLRQGADIEKAAVRFRTVKGVLSVEKDRIVQLH